MMSFFRSFLEATMGRTLKGARWAKHLCVAILVFSGGCQPDWLAGPCNRDKPELVYSNPDNTVNMEPQDGVNNIVQDPTAFTSCETFICLSTNGSKPYCTKPCLNDQECLNGNDVPMECKIITQSSGLACREPKTEYCGANANPEDLCCQTDPVTHAVKDPVKYCAAKDGAVAHDPRAKPAGTGG
jgi:hypothetical protein